MFPLATIGLFTWIFLIGIGILVLFVFFPTIVSLVLRLQLLLVKDPDIGIGAVSRPAMADDVRNLSDVLLPIRRRYKVPALAAAMVRDGKVTALGAAGVRRAFHEQRATQDDRFHLGSCTKAMTATLCGILVEQNKLRWASTIGEIFPDLAGVIDPGYQPATLEHLLSHRSGIEEGLDFSTSIWPKIWELKGPMLEQRLALTKLILHDKPGALPGSKYQYSNCGYTIAGAICERVTGKLWEDLMRELLFEPLGMTTAGFGPPGDPHKMDQPWGHQLGFWNRRWTSMPPGNVHSDNPAVIGPAGCVHCTLADWAKFALLHLPGSNSTHSILSENTIRLLQSPTMGGDYAFGWSVVERDWAGGKALSHVGSNTMWFSVIWLAPARNLALLAATNLGTQSAYTACDSAIAKMLDMK